jgi:hypothetical protein
VNQSGGFMAFVRNLFERDRADRQDYNDDIEDRWLGLDAPENLSGVGSNRYDGQTPAEILLWRIGWLTGKPLATVKRIPAIIAEANPPKSAVVDVQPRWLWWLIALGLWLLLPLLLTRAMRFDILLVSALLPFILVWLSIPIGSVAVYRIFESIPAIGTAIVILILCGWVLVLRLPADVWAGIALGYSLLIVGLSLFIGMLDYGYRSSLSTSNRVDTGSDFEIEERSTLDEAVTIRESLQSMSTFLFLFLVSLLHLIIYGLIASIEFRNITQMNALQVVFAPLMQLMMLLVGFALFRLVVFIRNRN